MKFFLKTFTLLILCLILMVPAALAQNGGSFTDVPPGYGFFDDIEAIYAAGITTGFSDGTYRPRDPVNRGQMAAFLARALKLKPAPLYSESITLKDGNKLEITVKDAGDWIEWCFDFPVEVWTGDGMINVGLIIAKDGLGEGPVFQIHNNDGTDPGFAYGTWLYSPWGPSITDGWNGWHSADDNNPVTDLPWVEASGERDAQGTDGKLCVRILKSELGDSFHWAAAPTVGSGWSGPVITEYLATPGDFKWSVPIVAADNYHELTLPVPTFPDVPPGYGFFAYIEAIYAEGITTGFSDGTYRPKDYVTRGQMAAFLNRAFLSPTSAD